MQVSTAIIHSNKQGEISNYFNDAVVVNRSQADSRHRSPI